MSWWGAGCVCCLTLPFVAVVLLVVCCGIITAVLLGAVAAIAGGLFGLFVGCCLMCLLVFMVDCLGLVLLLVFGFDVFVVWFGLVFTVSFVSVGCLFVSLGGLVLFFGWVSTSWVGFAVK